MNIVRLVDGPHWQKETNQIVFGTDVEGWFPISEAEYRERIDAEGADQRSFQRSRTGWHEWKVALWPQNQCDLQEEWIAEYFVTHPHEQKAMHELQAQLGQLVPMESGPVLFQPHMTNSSDNI